MPQDFGRDLYGGDEPAAPETSARDGESRDEGKTVLVNDDISPGLKPGDPLHLRVVETQEKQYVCEVENESEPEKGGAGEQAPMPSGGDSSMSSMMEG